MTIDRDKLMIICGTALRDTIWSFSINVQRFSEKHYSLTYLQYHDTYSFTPAVLEKSQFKQTTPALLPYAEEFAFTPSAIGVISNA